MSKDERRVLHSLDLEIPMESGGKSVAQQSYSRVSPREFLQELAQNNSLVVLFVPCAV